jgi:hypothetical protein
MNTVDPKQGGPKVWYVHCLTCHAMFRPDICVCTTCGRTYSVEEARTLIERELDATF